MSRNPDGSWPAPWWSLARDCEALYGREVAKRTWGRGYWSDDGDEQPQLTAADRERLDAMEKRINTLYAALAMRSAAREGQAIVAHVPAPARPWHPIDGLAAHPHYQDAV